MIGIKIKNISLNGFRGFKNPVSIEFDERLTVLIGDNGSGKTSILDATAKMMGFFIERLVPGVKVGGRKLSEFSRGDVSNDASVEEAVVKLDASIESQAGVHTVRWQSFINKTRPGYPQASDDESEDILGKLRGDVENAAEKREIFFFPTILYRSLGTPPTFKNRDLNADLYRVYDDYNETKINFDLFKDWFVWQERKESKNLSEIKKMLLGLWNDNEKNEIFTDILMDWENPQGAFKILKAGGYVLDNQLSAGERSLIALAGDIAHRLCLANPRAENPLEGNGVVLIDEIDVHLHPKWQRKVIPKLLAAFPNVQFVMTTHSPYVISSVYPHQIYFLVSTPEDGPQIVNAAKNGQHTKGIEPNRVLKDLMGAPLRDFETQADIETLMLLINELGYEHEATIVLVDKLTENLGVQDPFIMRLQHQKLMHNRKKAIQ